MVRCHVPMTTRGVSQSEQYYSPRSQVKTVFIPYVDVSGPHVGGATQLHPALIVASPLLPHQQWVTFHILGAIVSSAGASET